MLTEFAIAMGLIVAAGIVFLVLRGSSSPDPVGHKRKINRNQQRMEQAEEGDSDEDGEGPPDNEAISKWADST